MSFKDLAIRHKLATASNLEVRARGDIEGYASTYDVDRGGDRCVKGCFKKAVETAQKGSMPWMLYGHDTSRIVGEFHSMHEDDRGLRVAGKVWLDDAPDPALARMIVKAVTSKGGPMGMSIGYRAKKWSWDAEGIRNLEEVELLEISLVPIPMNAQATVESFKALGDEQPLGLRLFEARLREDFGFSRSEAEDIARNGYKSFLAKRARDERQPADENRETPRDEVGADLIAALRRNLTILKG